MPKIVFVPGDELGKTTADSRKLIRSHCMLGKNRKKGKGKKEPVDHGGDLGYQTPTGASVSNDMDLRALSATQYTLSPSPAGTQSAFSLLEFAREIDNRSRELLFKYFFVARGIFYPIQFCVYSDASLFTWFEWLFHDSAYLESVLLGMSAMDDFVRRTPPSKLTYSYMKGTITALNTRLSDPTLNLTDSTIAVVMGLAELSGIWCDDSAAKAHVSGFQRMVRLRGGISAFADNTKLQIKIGRFDLSYALSTGNPPQFFMDSISWSPIFQPQPQASINTPHAVSGPIFENTSNPLQPSSPPTPAPILNLINDPNLLLIFHDLLQFASILNTSSPDPYNYYSPILKDTEYQHLICSIQYRLLQLQDKLTTILDESIRLAMLAFLTTTFQVAGQRAVYPHLGRRFREFCRATSSDVPAEVVIWLLIVGGMAVFNIDGEDAEWMVGLWRVRIPVGWDWEEACGRLRGFPWIGVLHDEAGRVVFETLCRKVKESYEGKTS